VYGDQNPVQEVISHSGKRRWRIAQRINEQYDQRQGSQSGTGSMETIPETLLTVSLPTGKRNGAPALTGKSGNI